MALEQSLICVGTRGLGFGATSGQHHLQLLPQQSLSLGFCCYINFSGGSNPAKSLLRLLGNETQHCLDLPALLGARFGIAPKPRCSCPSPSKDPELWVPGSGPQLSPGMLQRAELGLSALQARARTLIHPHRQVNSQLAAAGGVCSGAGLHKSLHPECP